MLVVGAGGAGMYAALEAARRGAAVILADRSLIGRGGATVMAQMTVAVALDEHAVATVTLMPVSPNACWMKSPSECGV